MELRSKISFELIKIQNNTFTCPGIKSILKTELKEKLVLRFRLEFRRFSCNFKYFQENLMIFKYCSRILLNFQRFLKDFLKLRYFKEFKETLNVVKVEGL